MYAVSRSSSVSCIRIQGCLICFQKVFKTRAIVSGHDERASVLYLGIIMDSPFSFGVLN